MASGDVFRVGLEWTLNSSVRALTTFGLVEGAGLGGPDPMQDVATGVADAIGPTPISGWSANASLSGILVSDVQPGTRGGIRVPLGPFAGTIVDDMLPPQDAMVVHFSTGLKGKANNGRLYLPGWSEADQIAGFWQSTAMDNGSALMSALFAQFVDDATIYQLSLLSYVPASTPRALRAAVPIISFTIDNVVRSMRSRQVGRGQ